MAQIHGTKSDTLELRVEGEDGTAKDGLTWVVNWSDGNKKGSTTAHFPVKHGYRLGEEVAWEIHVDNGAVTVTIDGKKQFGQGLPLDGHHS